LLRRCSLLVLFALVCGACTGAPPPAPRREQPNVLLVVSDDERIESEAGRPFVHNWFKGGTTFTRAFATTPQCCPSRASILTGQYAHNHDIHRKRDAEGITATHTLPYHLKKAGYETGFAGKYLNGWPDKRKPPYFDRWALGVGYNDRPFVVQGKTQRAKYGPSFVFNLGERYIQNWDDTDDDKPWFLMLAPSAPHDPYQAQAKYDEETFDWRGNPAANEEDRSDKPPYVRRKSFSEGYGEALRESQLRTLRSLDDAFKLLVKRLTDTDELRNTIVVYVSDNGFMWAEHGLEGKGVPYLPSVRVPMYVRGPGIAKGRNDELVANIDIAPTIYSMLGIETGYTLDGRDLRTSERTELLLEFEGGGSIPKWWSLVTDRWQYIRYGSGLREFYDLTKDPFELDNEPGRVLIEMEVALSEAETCVGAKRCP
jgi:arylsulfatase A-like enzyme